MEGLRRDPAAAIAAEYDLIVVGGGIYGAMTTLEAARRGLRPLLLERDDYGGKTSWNSHRIVHGGLRYLQRLDFERFMTSVRERRWFLRHFPEVVRPLACLMPLYNEGARRPATMRIALGLNHLLSRHRNDDVPSGARLASGGVMTADETKALFPATRRDGLTGGALWYDAVMTDSQRVLMETLRWACARGARCLNYTEVTELTVESGRVRGVAAYDRVDEQELSFRADRVINCAGPWSKQLADSWARAPEGIFRPSLAFNLLFDRPAPSDVAVAVAAPGPEAHTWFMYPRNRLLYAGTAHFPHAGDIDDPTPSPQQIDSVIEHINTAVPQLELRREQILRVYAGFLPTTEAGGIELSDRPVVHDHGTAGGPEGLVSVSGVKYTTSRDVAEQGLRKAIRDLPELQANAGRPEAAVVPALETTTGRLTAGVADGVRRFAFDEAVVYAEDLLLRRGAWTDDPRNFELLEAAVTSALS